VRRLICSFALFLLLAALPAAAQDTPATTPDPSSTQPQVVPTTEAGAPPAATTEPPADAQPPPFDANALELIINARNDLELLAGAHMGSNRPVGWSGSLDIKDPQLPLLLRLDLELLAGTLLAPDKRPTGWFGPVAGSPYSVVRDVRHDLELLADTLDKPNVRPPGWVGGDPLMRCDRSLQTLVNVLERGGIFSLNVDVNAPDFCKLAENQATQFADSNIVANPAAAAAPVNGASQPGATAGQGGGAAAGTGSAQINSNFAVAFLDRYGTKQVGAVPVNTVVTVVARSFAPFSHMTLVRGDGFEVFIDYKSTNLTDAQFNSLPDVDGVTVNPACNASWCKPVVTTLGNPASGRAGFVTSRGATARPTGSVKVPVENLVILYDGQDSNNTTVVRMQLCAKATGQAGNTCEPVTQVVAPNGAPLASVGSLSGIPQFRLPYGYSTHTLRSQTYFMTDVWVAQPGKR
jgi:hypothetical protein